MTVELPKKPKRVDRHLVVGCNKETSHASPGFQNQKYFIDSQREIAGVPDAPARALKEARSIHVRRNTYNLDYKYVEIIIKIEIIKKIRIKVKSDNRCQTKCNRGAY